MKKLMFQGIILVSLFTFNTPSAIAQPQTIAALAELSGNFSKNGEDCRIGYEIAKQAYPGVSVIIADNQNDPKVGITEFRRLVEMKNASALVTTRSSVGLAINPLSKNQKIPLIGVVGHPRFITENPYSIRFFSQASDEASVLANYVSKNNFSKISIISVEDEYFLRLRDDFINSIGENKITFNDTVLPTEQDFSTLITKLKAKSPDMIFINLIPTQIGQFLKKAKENGINQKTISNFLIGTSDLLKTIDKSLSENIIFAEMDYNKPNYLKAFSRISSNNSTSSIGYSCYASLTYAFELLKQSQNNKKPMIEEISEIKKIKLLDGEIAIKDREAQFEVIPKIIKNGTVQRLINN